MVHRVVEEGRGFISRIADHAFRIDGEPRLAVGRQNVVVMKVRMKKNAFVGGGEELVADRLRTGNKLLGKAGRRRSEYATGPVLERSERSRPGPRVKLRNHGRSDRGRFLVPLERDLRERSSGQKPLEKKRTLLCVGDEYTRRAG